MLYRFADCTLDTDRHRFMRGGEPVALEPQVFDLLALLAANPGRLVSKEMMIDQVWGGRIVSEATISSRISAARTAVGDNGRDQRVIKTIARRGIELVADVDADDKPTPEVPKVPQDEEIDQKIRFTTSRDGTRIAYAVSGNGPLLMRAGHFLTHLEREWTSPVWRPYLQELSKAHTVVRYDMRATGLSDREVEDLSLRAYAEDVLAVADAAGMDRFPLVAASQSVPIALHFAAHHPDRISRLVLYGGFAQGRSVRPGVDAKSEALMLNQMMRQGWGQKGSAFMKAFSMLYCPEGTPEEIEDLAELQRASVSPEGALRVREALDRYDALEYLPRVKAPTLVMHASGDALQPVEQSRIIAAGLADAEFVELNTNNHVYLNSDPVWPEFVSRILNFVAEG